MMIMPKANPQHPTPYLQPQHRTPNPQLLAQAKDVNNIIRSTVSIAFVVNTDELVYNACTPMTIKNGYLGMS